MVACPAVSDAQTIAGAITVAGGAIAAAITAVLRYAVKRITKAQDQATLAIIESARTSATLVARVDAFDARLDHAIRAISAAPRATGQLPEPRATRPTTPRTGVDTEKRTRRSKTIPKLLPDETDVDEGKRG